jgi:hypothetical protein
MDRYVSNQMFYPCCNFWLQITEHGDCGSWVIDPNDGTLYGYVTAGDPGTSIAYIIPAYQAFHEIEQKMGAKITFPCLESLVERSGTGSNDGTTQVANPQNAPGAATVSDDLPPIPSETSKSSQTFMPTRGVVGPKSPVLPAMMTPSTPIDWPGELFYIPATSSREKTDWSDKPAIKPSGKPFQFIIFT